jgi:VCBS repeat-containing protein
VSDGHGGIQTAVATIAVADVNDGPAAGDTAFGGTEDTVLQADAAHGVLATATDADGDALAASLTQDAAHGHVELNSDGSFTYSPSGDFAGTDQFTYQVSDGHGGVQTATATITVAGVNDGPAAGDTAFGGTEDTVLQADAAHGVLATATDADGDALAASLTQDAAHGHVELNSDGSFTYSPSGDFAGTDQFTYQVSDGHGGVQTAVATITVAAAPPEQVSAETPAPPVPPAVAVTEPPGLNSTDTDSVPVADPQAVAPVTVEAAVSSSGTESSLPSHDSMPVDQVVADQGSTADSVIVQTSSTAAADEHSSESAQSPSVTSIASPEADLAAPLANPVHPGAVASGPGQVPDQMAEADAEPRPAPRETMSEARPSTPSDGHVQTPPAETSQPMLVTHLGIRSNAPESFDGQVHDTQPHATRESTPAATSDRHRRGGHLPSESQAPVARDEVGQELAGAAAIATLIGPSGATDPVRETQGDRKTFLGADYDGVMLPPQARDVKRSDGSPVSLESVFRVKEVAGLEVSGRGAAAGEADTAGNQPQPSGAAGLWGRVRALFGA